ncbi:hypothetical protein CTEN210_17327 [Chaetoceros tenuissimus]|uniref:Mini-chromosome maintenance complex-binding protein n=1 Tax=Chaetoceros tenuissimus TaxID=426638 RepID=A0AAD3DAH1_9STRA|nr:hypothetical protein CTEN210_17327 [Chaetoceros tenuissimus]
MPAVVIPPSPQDKVPSTEKEVIGSVVSKILDGKEAVTSSDLTSLDKAIEASNLKNLVRPEDTSSIDSSATRIPLVDRNYIKTCDSNPGLVRYIGMVQDMLDPEYYVSKVRGVHTKYKEYFYQPGAYGDDHEELHLNHLLEERQPLLLVPIPNASKALLDNMKTAFANNNDKNDTFSMNQEENVINDIDATSQNQRKRALDDDCNEGRKSFREDSTDANDANLGKTGNGSNVKGNNDWWPKGCMGSEESQLPVLAKMYYDSDFDEQSGASSQTQRRLQLNDIVEVFGILSVDPQGAVGSFANQNSETCASGFDMNCDLQTDHFFNDFMDVVEIPPPSQLPRLHVLKYRSIDLNELMPIEKIPSPIATQEDDRDFTIRFFAENIFDGNKVAGELLLLCMMSSAERDSQDKVMTIPSGSALGAASINYVLKDTESCNILQRKLNAVLQQICAVAANVNLSLESLNCEGSTTQMITSPAKNSMNRLEPSILQLPKSSSIIVNQMGIGHGNLTQRGERTLRALSKLSSTHFIPYQFDGMMELDFEADVRLIVLSPRNNSATSGSKLLPCSMSMVLDSSFSGDESMSSMDMESVQRIRRFISNARSNGSISLPKDLLSRSQKDFITRRQRSRISSSKEVEEADFHRWLLLTRLQARSRPNGNEQIKTATIQDWENALAFDDKINAL